MLFVVPKLSFYLVLVLNAYYCTFFIKFFIKFLRTLKVSEI